MPHPLEMIRAAQAIRFDQIDTTHPMEMSIYGAQSIVFDGPKRSAH